MYNIFLKEVANLEISLYHTLLLKTLRMFHVHQLEQSLNEFSTILPFDQLHHDWEVFPYIVSSHHLIHCRMYQLKEQDQKKLGCTYRKLVELKT